MDVGHEKSGHDQESVYQKINGENIKLLRRKLIIRCLQLPIIDSQKFYFRGRIKCQHTTLVRYNIN